MALILMMSNLSCDVICPVVSRAMRTKGSEYAGPEQEIQDRLKHPRGKLRIG